jgi:outer membrane protein assembly factor BamB
VVKFVDAPPLTTVVVVAEFPGEVVVVAPDDGTVVVVATAALCKSKLYVGSENDTAETEIFSDSPTTVVVY